MQSRVIVENREFVRLFFSHVSRLLKPGQVVNCCPICISHHMVYYWVGAMFVSPGNIMAKYKVKIKNKDDMELFWAIQDLICCAVKVGICLFKVCCPFFYPVDPVLTPW